VITYVFYIYQLHFHRKLPIGYVKIKYMYKFIIFFPQAIQLPY